MTGFGDAFARFDAELDAAVSRARRIGAEARAESAKFRAQTAKLTESVRDRSLTARPEELTSERLREQATRFRAEQGLPVEPLPSAAELAAAGMVAEPRRLARYEDDEDFSQERILSASIERDEQQPEPAQPPSPPAPPARPHPPRRRPVPRTGDDDDDFSQERILFEG